MDIQEVTLTWDDQHKSLVGIFVKLLENSTLVDCTIAAEGQYLKAHKVVLSTCSPYFEMLFTQENEKNPIVVLKDVSFQDLKALIDFMYHGKVQIPEDRLADFTDAAISLQIKGLDDGHKQSISEGEGRKSPGSQEENQDLSVGRKRRRDRLQATVEQNVENNTPEDTVTNKRSRCKNVPDNIPSYSMSALTSTSGTTSSDLSYTSRVQDEDRTTGLFSSASRYTELAEETRLEPISEILLPETMILVEPKSEVWVEETSILDSNGDAEETVTGTDNEETRTSADKGEMDIQELMLAWDDHHKGLVGGFVKLLENSTLVDCTIAAEGQYLKVHKIVLSACSPYFEMLFTQENEKYPTVVLKDVSFQDLKALIDFMYHGKVQIPKYRLRDFTDAAISLQIKGLEDSHKQSISEGEGRKSPGSQEEEGQDLPVVQKRRRNHLLATNEQNVGNDIPEDTVTNIRLKCENVPDNIPSFSMSALTSATGTTFSDLSHISRVQHEDRTTSLSSSASRYTEWAEETRLEPISEVLLPETMILVEPKSEVWLEETSILVSNGDAEETVTGTDNEETRTSVEPESEVWVEGTSILDSNGDAEGETLTGTDIEETRTSGSTTRSIKLYPVVRLERMNWKKQGGLQEDSSREAVVSLHTSSASSESTEFSKYSTVTLTESPRTVPESNSAPSMSISNHKVSKTSSKASVVSSEAHSESSSVVSSEQTKPEASQQGCKRKKHACPECYKLFRSPKELVVHRRRHYDERTYVCQFCSKGFFQSNDLTRHIRIHTGEKPYLCNDCGQSFRLKVTLKLHMQNVHGKELPYQCDQCGQKFAKQNKLLSHKQVHRLIFKYTCKCGMYFTEKSLLEQHWIQVHANERKPHMLQGEKDANTIQ